MDLELSRSAVSSPSQDGVKGPAIGPAPDLSTGPRNEVMAAPVRSEPPAPTPPGWTGTLPAAFLESERAGGGRVAFVSASWEAQPRVRVESASSLVCQLEKVAALPQAGAGAPAFGVRENGTIVHAATERPAYHRVDAEQRYPPKLQEAVDRHFAEADKAARASPAIPGLDASDPRQVQGPQGPVVKNDDQLRSFQTAQRQDPRLTPAEFARAQEKSMLCDASYMPALEQRGAIPPYFERATDEALARDPNLVFDDPRTGFHAELYRDKRDNTYCLVFRGTDTDTRMDTVRDSLSGNVQALLPSARQFKEAMGLATRLKELPEYRSALTEMSGHSLGGALAAAAALVTRTTATTFNAAGLNHQTVGSAWDAARAKDTIRNFRVDGELLTFGQEDLKSGVSAGYQAMGVIAEQHGVPGARLAGRVAGGVVGHIPAAAGTQVTMPALRADGRPSLSADVTFGERASRHSASRVMASMCLSPERHQ